MDRKVEGNDRCPKCAHPRYKEDTQPVLEFCKSLNLTYLPDEWNARTRRINTACLVYRYFPISARLRQLFKHKAYSRYFRYGDGHMFNDDPDKIDDVHQSPRWLQFSRSIPLKSELAEMTSDERVNVDVASAADVRVGLLLSADSASLSKFGSNEFSLTPIVLSILNWPVKIRHQVEHLLFTGITPMNHKALDIYLGTIVHCFSLFVQVTQV
jgi:hypothetical protein